VLLQTDKKMLAAIEKRFPGTVIDGKLDRKKLGPIVFSDDQALLDLNAITHKSVKEKVIHIIGINRELAAIDAIELFDGGLADLCDVTVAITAPEEDRIQRLLERDGISREHAALRIRAQKPESYFREKCDHVLENNGTQEDFQEKCLAFFKEFIIMK
jgi:dephospho-CoA kinase